MGSSVIAVSLALGVHAPREAAAQPPSTSPQTASTEKKEAEARFQAGLKHYDVRDFERARLAFIQAYALYRSPAILRNLALSELYGTYPLDALRHFQEYMALDDVPAEKRAEAKKYADEAYAKTGHLRITTADGATVTVGDRSFDAPLASPVDVAVGSVDVTARAGGRAYSQKVVAKAGVVTEVELSLPAAGAAGAPAKVAPGGGAGGAGPGPGPGPGGADAPTILTTKNVVGGSLVAIGIVGAGLGVGFLLKAEGQVSDAAEFNTGQAGGACATRSQASCGTYQSMLDDASSTRGMGTGFLIGGLALAGVGAVVLLWPSARARDVARDVLRPGSLGTSANLRFSF